MSRNMTVRLALQARTANDEQLMCLACGNFLQAGKHVEFVVMMNGGAPVVGLHRACMSSVHHVRRRGVEVRHVRQVNGSDAGARGGDPRASAASRADDDNIGTIDDDDEFAAAICGVSLESEAS